MCSYAPGYVDCAGNLRVNVTSFSNFGAVTTPPCVDTAGDLVPDATSTAVPGAANEVVLVTVCYEWELAGKLPFLEARRHGQWFGDDPCLHDLQDRTLQLIFKR